MRSPKIDSSAHLSASDQQPLPLSILLAMFAELVRRFVIFFVIVELSWNFVRLMCLHILYLLQVMIDCVEQTTGIKTSTQGSSSRHGYEGGCQASWHGSFHVEAVSALLPFSLTRSDSLHSEIQQIFEIGGDFLFNTGSRGPWTSRKFTVLK